MSRHAVGAIYILVSFYFIARFGITLFLASYMYNCWQGIWYKAQEWWTMKYNILFNTCCVICNLFVIYAEIFNIYQYTTCSVILRPDNRNVSCITLIMRLYGNNHNVSYVCQVISSIFQYCSTNNIKETFFQYLYAW